MSANSDARRAAKRMEMNGKKLVNVDPFETGLLPHADYRSQEDHPLSPAGFVEQFVGTMFVNWLVLKDADYGDDEIRMELGPRGAIFHGNNEVAVAFMSPACIPHPGMLPLIRKHFLGLVERYRRGEVNSAALEAEKVAHCQMLWINAFWQKAKRQ